METKKRTERGQSALEFALILPIMMLMVVGIADFGRAFFGMVALAGGAREGARWGSVRQCSDTTGADTDSIQYRIIQAAQGTTINAASGITITYPDGASAVGNRIRIVVTSTFNPLTPVIGNLTVALAGGTLTMSQTAEALIETVNAAC